MRKILSLVITMFVLCGLKAENVIINYKAIPSAEYNLDFSVKVRKIGGEWEKVPVYPVKVDEVLNAKHNVRIASMAYFDFQGEVEVAVESHKGKIESNKIRPLSYSIKGSVEADSVLIFKLNQPRNLSIEVNGDIFHNLHLFANPIDNNLPAKPKKRKDIIYFAPGIHKLPGDTLRVPSGKTVYIAGGAIVKGTLKIDGVRDVNVFGRGEIHPEGRGAGLEIKCSHNVKVEGIITTQCPTGQSDSVSISNVKAISSYGWGDGMNVFASSHVYFDGVFCRNSDDCTTVYATRMGHKGSCDDIVMRNSTLWADVAHPIMIGIHGNSKQPDTITNLRYENIDILDHCENQIDYQGCMAINAGDNNMISNVVFDNIRVENFRKGQLVALHICYNKKYCTAPGRGIDNILFRNITYTGGRATMSTITGYNEDRRITNVRFENLVINGKHIYDGMPDKPKWYKTSDMCNMFVGEHVDDIVFK